MTAGYSCPPATAAPSTAIAVASGTESACVVGHVWWFAIWCEIVDMVTELSDVISVCTCNQLGVIPRSLLLLLMFRLMGNAMIPGLIRVLIMGFL